MIRASWSLVPLALLAFGAASAAEPALHVDAVAIKGRDGGKDLIIRFTETRRDARTSEVRVEYESGASVPSAMFIAKGMWTIARQRGAAYFINLKEWRDGEATRYLVGFGDDDTVDPRTFFGAIPDLKDDLAFLSVADFALVFEAQGGGGGR